MVKDREPTITGIMAYYIYHSVSFAQVSMNILAEIATVGVPTVFIGNLKPTAALMPIYCAFVITI